MNDDHQTEQSCSKKGCQPIKVPTDDEVIALNTLRTIKDRVREIKKRISILSKNVSEEGDREISRLNIEMESLNMEWKAWMRKRDEAAQERMILLGHIEP